MCGGRGLFHRWVCMAEDCPTCGFHFQRNEGHWQGSWFLNIVVAQTVMTGVLIALVGISWPDRPPLAGLVVVPVLAVLVPLVLFPVSRTLWTAIDLCMRPLDFDEGVAPSVELDQLEAAGARRARPWARAVVSRPSPRSGPPVGPSGGEPPEPHEGRAPQQPPQPDGGTPPM